MTPVRKPQSVDVEPARRTLVADGDWCPMAHCNRLDNSFHSLAPLRSVSERIAIRDPSLSPRGHIHLGAFTGRKLGVCIYAGKRRPAVAAFDYARGDVLWTSAPEDLIAYPERIPAGILIASMSVAGKLPRTYIFAANPSEFVAWTASGRRLWKRSCRDISAEAPEGVGIPISISYTDSGELFAATTGGWVLLLEPLDGSVIDAWRMDTRIELHGEIYDGIFANYKSPVLAGDSIYLIVEFLPRRSTPLTPPRRPVHVIRLEISRKGGRTRILPLQPADYVPIGAFKGRGSPPGMVTRRGTFMIFATACRIDGGSLQPVISGLEHDGRGLRLRWQCDIRTPPGDRVHSAPALDARTGTLLVTTRHAIFRFNRADSLCGEIASPEPLPAPNLIERGGYPGVRVRYGSPIALAYDRQQGDLVACTNFILSPHGRLRSFGFLGAFSIDPDSRTPPRPLWSESLAPSGAGRPSLGVGTFGQPALFQDPNGQTGILVNTAHTGTYIFK